MASRVDDNQPAIVRGLRRCGYRVLHLHELGHGVPDLLIGTPWGTFALLEVKGPNGELTPDQVVWHREWSRFPVLTARTTQEAVDKLEALRPKKSNPSA